MGGFCRSEPRTASLSFPWPYRSTGLNRPTDEAEGGIAAGRMPNVIMLWPQRAACLKKKGSAGNLPAPSGNLPDGTAERVSTERPSPLARTVPSIPSGW
jgi:hypothetical protein